MKTRLKAIWEGALICVTIMAAALLSICIIFGWIAALCLCSQVSAWCALLFALYPPAVLALKKIVGFSMRKWGNGSGGERRETGEAAEK